MKKLADISMFESLGNASGQAVSDMMVFNDELNFNTYDQVENAIWDLVNKIDKLENVISRFYQYGGFKMPSSKANKLIADFANAKQEWRDSVEPVKETIKNWIQKVYDAVASKEDQSDFALEKAVYKHNKDSYDNSVLYDNYSHYDPHSFTKFDSPEEYRKKEDVKLEPYMHRGSNDRSILEKFVRK